jgi:zinc protease
MIYETVLPNGLEIVIKKIDSPVVSVQCWVDVGSVDEMIDELGFCHFVEHMLFKGTKKRSTQEIADLVEGKGGEFNAFTSFEYTVYYINIANKKFDLASDVLFDMLNSSEFYKDEFLPEKEVILEEMKRGDDNPDSVLYKRLYKEFYGNIGYGRPVIGTKKTIQNATNVSLKNFWKKWYVPSLMTLVIAGGVEIESTLNFIKKTWGKVPLKKALRKRRKEIGFKCNPKKNSNLKFHQAFDVNNIRWVGALPCPSIFDEDVAVADLTSMILGFGESSRLYHALYRENHLVNSVSASSWTPSATGMFVFDVDASTEQLGKFRKVLDKEIKRFCDEGPSSNELERVKTNIETDRIYSRQTVEDIANRLGFLKTIVGNVYFDLEYMANVKELGAEDVRIFSKNLFEKNPLLEVVMTPLNFEVKKFWDSYELETKTLVTSKKEVHTKSKKESSNIERVVLKEGLELAFCYRKDVPIVSINTVMLGGQRSEVNFKSGISHLMSELWDKGPEGMSSLEFSSFIESKASSIRSFSGRNSFGLKLTTITKYLDDVLPVYIDTLLSPAFDKEEFEKAKLVTIDEIKTLEDNGAKFCFKKLNEVLFEGHPFAMHELGTIDSVQSIDLSEIKDFYLNQTQKSKMVVAIAGKFNKEKILKAFEKINRPNKVLALEDFIVPIEPLKVDRIVEVKKNREQSHIVIGYRGFTVNSPYHFDVQTLISILGGMSGRLFREVRDKKGLCYTVSPIYFEGLETGLFGVYIGTDPKKRDDAISAIKEQLKIVMEKPVSKQEIEKAKESLVGRQAIDLQLNSSHSEAIAYNLLFNKPIDLHLNWEENLKKVTPKSVQKCAQSLFDANSVISIVI